MNQGKSILYFGTLAFTSACLLSDSFAELIHKKFVSKIQNQAVILGKHDRFLTSEDIFGSKKK